MPTVSVLYFASVRERIGAAQERLELPARADEATLRARLGELHPDAATLIACSRIAVDEDFVRGEVELREGAEIAVIPPVSGG